MKLGERVLVNLGAFTLTEAVVTRIGDTGVAVEVEVAVAAGLTGNKTSKYWLTPDKVVDTLASQTQPVPVS